jgi:1-acyl-sn-glycerol-3-phosphate acyltransferase
MKSRLHRIWYGLVVLWFRLTMFPLYRVRVFGKEHVPAEGPVLIAGNHQSFLDPIFCQIPVRRNLNYLSRDTLYDHWFFGPLIRTLNTIPIRRGQSDIAAMRAVIDKLRQNHAVVIFPESTRTQDGRIAEVKAGFALLARRSGATIVPTIIDGAYEAGPATENIRIWAASGSSTANLSGTNRSLKWAIASLPAGLRPNFADSRPNVGRQWADTLRYPDENTLLPRRPAQMRPEGTPPCKSESPNNAGLPGVETPSPWRKPFSPRVVSCLGRSFTTRMSSMN